MGETAPSPNELCGEAKLQETVGVRAPFNSYITVFLLGTYACALLFYAEYTIAGFTAFLVAWVVVPFLAASDHILFNGRRLMRTGIIPVLWAKFSSKRTSLRISDIEQVDTQAVRVLRRGNRVHYRYRTCVRGRGVALCFTSHGENFRRLIAALLPRLNDEVLDARSLDLRTYPLDPKEVLMKASFAGIPGSDVIKATVTTRPSRMRGRVESELDISEEGDNRVRYLADLGNELRLSGFLVRALECFRRALLIQRRNGRLIYDLSRCLQSLAATERSPRLARRSVAALKLAERYADGNASLLARIGESFAQMGDWRSAEKAFNRALDAGGDTFLATRGLAETALRDGKVAHVIHRFAAAANSTLTPALRRWSRHEAIYYTHLNSDETYMEMEVGRVGLLETLQSLRRTLLRITSFGLFVLAVGIAAADGLITNVGWAISGIALAVWLGLKISSGLLSDRIAYDEIASDEQ
ncbi:MAG: Tetratricopeptide repeat protein [Acidobacteria bacterium OLB17]|nr:MAG: Tetratricopeptide repeat protein [Acidobacteria bacterium OLB17]MCZ2391918.1 tetratricopeptide repeat protein [Acidobacteriota bacterium]